jgi:pimeloyl-ACP methyl ester carboxylesterase
MTDAERQNKRSHAPAWERDKELNNSIGIVNQEERDKMECKVKDVTIYYEEYGNGNPLLLLHGWPGDHRLNWKDFEPLFSQRKGWRRIYPDLPGMGKTRGADWITNQDHMLEIVLGFMDAIAPGENFTIAGGSYGGYLARGIVHHRGSLLNGMMISVPLVELDPEKRHLPEHQVIHEDATFLAALTPEEQARSGTSSRQTLQNWKILFPAFAIADRNRAHPRTTSV